MILYYIFALFAIGAAFHLYRGELITGLGINLFDNAYKAGADSYDFVLTANAAKDSGIIQLGDGTAFADLNDKADIDSTTLDLSSDATFTAGSLLLTKSGRQVVMTVVASGEHSSASSAETASGFVPASFRPANNNIANATFQDTGTGGTNFNVLVRTDGSVRFNYEQKDGTAVARINTGSAHFCVWNTA